MQIDGWTYYNHAAIPQTPPHEMPNMRPVESGDVWKIAGGGVPLLARWTTDFDCGYETNWWYVIKDTPFDIVSLKAKRRYEINKGDKNFQIRKIKPSEYPEEMFMIATSAYETYPSAYRPNITHESFIDEVTKRDGLYITYGAFSNSDGQLYGYACLREENGYIDFTELKVVPDMEKLSINAALVNKILNDYSDFIAAGGYICDGARNINHETAFQNYLEKYFGFRRAYCRLHICYNPKISILIKILFPLRKALYVFYKISFVHLINSVMKMEEICRSNLF